MAVPVMRAIVALVAVVAICEAAILMRPDTGYPAGFLPDCPGIMKNATISPTTMQQFSVIVQKVINGQVRRRSLPVETAWKSILKDKEIDLKNRKTVLYAVGYIDSSVFPHTQAIGNAYAKKGYNVLITETLNILSNIYPKSVRLARTLGQKLGEFLVKLYEHGLDPNKLELVGASLGAHVAAFAAKYFYQATGKKPSRVTGLDPAGPCYRNMPPDYKLAATDAMKVDVIHTNIDGFGIAERLGHIDFYVNGGEFQPSDIPALPCLVFCSHVRAIIYWWQALEHPKKFIAMRCDSIQDARYANCFNSSDTNYMGLETKFDKQGIFYLPTHNEFPYYRAKEGLKKDNEIYTSVVRSINSGDDFVV